MKAFRYVLTTLISLIFLVVIMNYFTHYQKRNECKNLQFTSSFSLKNIKLSDAKSARVVIYDADENTLIDSTSITINETEIKFASENPLTTQPIQYNFKDPLPINANWEIHFANHKIVVISDIETELVQEYNMFGKVDICVIKSFKANGVKRHNVTYLPDFSIP